MAAAVALCGAMVACAPSSRGARGLPPVSSVNPARGSVRATKSRSNFRIQAFFDVQNDPIVKEALKEPVAFLGGVFAGLLRLDLNEDPLREWVAKTAEAAGIEPEEPQSSSSDEGPNEITIE